MSRTLINDTTKAFKELFTEITTLYKVYINMLESYLKQIPDHKIEEIHKINALLDEVLMSLSHDMNIFEQVINSDLENINNIHDKLKIDQIYKKLQI